MEGIVDMFATIGHRWAWVGYLDSDVDLVEGKHYLCGPDPDALSEEMANYFPNQLDPRTYLEEA